MSDIVKIVFDGDLTPLQQKQAVAKGQLNAFVAESEAEIKGIATAGDAIGTSVQKGAESFTKYYKPVISDTSRDIKALSLGFERVLGVEGSREARAGLDDLGAALKKLNLDGYEAAASSQVLNLELRSINKQLKEYQFDLAAASAENIFFTETEVAAAAAVKATGGHGLAGGSQPLRGYGGLFRATGLTNAGVNETEANAALNIISKLGISVSSLVAVGGVAALGAAAVLVSSKLKEEADKRLESEEGIAGAINKQVLGLREALSDYQKIKDQLAQQEALQRKITGLVAQNDTSGVKALRDKTDQDNISQVTEINRLEAQLAQNEKSLAFEKSRKVQDNLLSTVVGGGLTASQQRQNVSTAETSVEQTKKQLAEAEDKLRKGTSTLKELDNAEAEITKNQDARFADQFASRRKSLEDEKQFNEKVAAERKAAADKFKESVKQGNEEVKRLAVGYKEEFGQLFTDVNRDNPFAAQIIQNAKALETLEAKLKGVGPELRKQATDLQIAANAQQIYTLQINTAFQAIDLHAQADRFRNPTQKDLQGSLNDRIAEFRRTSNSTNPDVFSDFQREQKRIEELDRKQRQDVLDKKLDVADRAKTDAQKALADSAVASFAGGLNPDDLTKGERAKIADALERSAVRTEARQQRALRVQEDLLSTLRSIDKRGETLAGIANAKGKEGLEASISIKDGTENGITTEVKARRPTQEDVSNLYGPFSGGGGLSSF